MRLEKKQLVNDIGNLIESSQFLYMISYKGLKVNEFDELRHSLEDVNAQCTVLKNTLIKKAAELKGKENLSKMDFSGDTALVTGTGDPGAVAKSLSDFAKKHKMIVAFKGGYLNGTVLKDSDVAAISKLPPRKVLLAQLLGTLQAPKRNLVSLLNTKLSGIAYVLSSYKDKLSK